MGTLTWLPQRGFWHSRRTATLLSSIDNTRSTTATTAPASAAPRSNRNGQQTDIHRTDLLSQTELPCQSRKIPQTSKDYRSATPTASPGDDSAQNEVPLRTLELPTFKRRCPALLAPDHSSYSLFLHVKQIRLRLDRPGRRPAMSPSP